MHPDDNPAIETVAIVGLGALGILYGQHLAKRLPFENLRFIADAGRIERYRREPVTCNGAVCTFNYVLPEAQTGPADLVIFAVKHAGLPAAIKAVQNQVGPRTILISVLNGITSESIIGQTYGAERLLYCTAQGMSAVKVINQMTFDRLGLLFIGDWEPGTPSEKAQRLARFLDRVELPYELATDMVRRLWSKFMLNVGVNQVVAVLGGVYQLIQVPGPARDRMIAAMREVMRLARLEGIDLREADIEWWLTILDRLDPCGKPSLRQDLEAGRPSEVELFSGQVLALGRKHGVPTPVNQMLYDEIKAIESAF